MNVRTTTVRKVDYCSKSITKRILPTATTKNNSYFQWSPRRTFMPSLTFSTVTRLSSLTYSSAQGILKVFKGFDTNLTSRSIGLLLTPEEFADALLASFSKHLLFTGEWSYLKRTPCSIVPLVEDCVWSWPFLSLPHPWPVLFPSPVTSPMASSSEEVAPGEI